MKTRNLDESAFKATMTSKMQNVTESGDAADVDVFAYVDAVPPNELEGHEIYDQFVEYVWRTADGRFDHVNVMTKTKNVYLVVVVDRAANAVHGHHLLDLNELYGLRDEKPSPR